MGEVKEEAIVELEDVARKWFGKFSKGQATRREGKLKIENIIWDGVRCDVSKPTEDQGKKPIEKGRILDCSSTTYVNTTSTSIQNWIYSERKHKTKFICSIRKGFMLGGKLELNLPVPKTFLNISAKIKASMHVDLVNGIVEEKDITWSNKSCVTVPAKCEVTATVTSWYEIIVMDFVENVDISGIVAAVYYKNGKFHSRKDVNIKSILLDPDCGSREYLENGFIKVEGTYELIDYKHTVKFTENPISENTSENPPNQNSDPKHDDPDQENDQESDQDKVDEGMNR